MATLQPVSEEEWERHKDVLKSLYCSEKLPLFNRKGNGHEPGVVELMKERHAFVASPSQYELQFKKWGFTKNLKSGEWAALIAQYDRLRQTKSDVRITVSGSVLDKSKIDKARRRYRLHHNGTQGRMCKGSGLPASRQAHVEFLDESGAWTTNSDPEVKNSTVMIRRKSGHASGNNSLETANRADIGSRKDMDPFLSRDERPVNLLQGFDESIPVHQSFSPIIDVDELFTTSTFNIDNWLCSDPPSSFRDPTGISGVSESCPNSTATSVASKNISSQRTQQAVALGRVTSSPVTRMDSVGELIASVVQHCKMNLNSKKTFPRQAKIPDADEIIETLNSLLSDTQTPSREYSGPALCTRSSYPSSHLFDTLLYSFRNNFAGFCDVPRASIMQLIREHHDIRTQLFNVISCGLPSVAKPLADNFFRAAVEGNDADAVVTIIHHTKPNSAIAIDPNDVVCNFEHKDYTPIELAAKFRNRELVQVLLCSGADPNKTYKLEHKPWLQQGALDHALGRWDNENLAENAMRPGPGHTAVAEELMSRISARRHRLCFESEWLLISAIHYLEKSAADKIVERLFTHCSESDDCGKCASERPLLMEKLLCHSARRGNIDLTKFLAQHTAQLQSGLAAAIRASSNELIEFFLSNGSRVDAPVESWRRCSHYGGACPDLYDEGGYDRLRYRNGHERQDYVITPIRTPLAEAIRSRNNHLLSNFQRLGAFTRLSDEHHFHAAVLAAVEAGDLASIKMILSYASSYNKGSNLTLPLAVAIRNDETDAALMLLETGAKCNLEIFNAERRHGNPLIIALEQSNRRVVDCMLECDVEIPSKFNSSGKSALEAAAAWGDVELVIDLMRAGADIDGGVKITPLGAAVRTGNRNFVSQMLDLGADLQATLDDPDVVTPLKAAMETGDYDMVRFLILKGAPPTDTCAFLYAMSHDPMGYEILLSEVKRQHPRGLPGFGAPLLAQAIELGSRPLMESLLRAGADMNSWCEMGMTYKGASESRRRPPLGFHKRRVLGLAITHRNTRNLELIRELLDRGVDTGLIVYEFQWSSSSGPITTRETPLLLAVQLKKLDVVRMLLEHGADLNRPARRGIKRTPLQAACEAGSYSIVELFLKQGARVNDAAAERYGGTALQLAAKSGSLKIVRLLLDNGADPFMPKSKVGGRTPFEAAAESGCVDVLRQLWDAVLPLGFSQKECQSAKEFANRKGHRGCAEFIDFLSGGPLSLS